MPPSASKQKRLAEKAAKKSVSGKTTPSTSVAGGSTPLTSLSANGSTEDLVDAAEQMRKLNLATDRSAVSPVSACMRTGHELTLIPLYRTVSSLRTSRDVISRLSSTLCLSTADSSLRVPRSRSTTVSGMLSLTSPASQVRRDLS